MQNARFRQSTFQVYRVASAILLLTLAAMAPTAFAETYDISIPLVAQDVTVGSGLSRVEGTLTTSQLGSFTTPAAIESLFNSSSVSLQVLAGDDTAFVVDDSAPWEFLFSVGASAVVTTSPTQLSIDFSTPSENSVVEFNVYGPPGRIQFRQDNHVSDTTEIFVDYEFPDASPPIYDSSSATFAYDSALIFPVVPEPSGWILCGIGFAAFVRFRRKRK